MAEKRLAISPVFDISKLAPNLTDLFRVPVSLDGFGGLVVSILTTGTRLHGFKPGRNRWIFRASGKSSVCLPSEGK